MRAVSLFSGVGGMDLGLERAGIQIVAQCELDSWRRDVLAHHWPDVPRYSDVREVTHAELYGRRGPLGAVTDGGHSGGPVEQRPTGAGVDLLCGGFPCQDLSVAGRRAGLEAGERSSLFFEFARIADELRPEWLLIENVPGLLSSNGGRDFAILLATLAELGFAVAWRVLDSRFFGVAQRRRRVFIVGRAGNRPGPAEVLFEREGGDGNPAPRPEARAGVAGSVADGARVAGPLTRRYGKGVNTTVDDGAVVVSHTLRSEGFDASEDGTGRGTPIVVAPTVVNALTRDMAGAGGGADDNTAQGGHLVPVGFHMTQDPIHSDNAIPAMGRKSAGMGVAHTAGVRRLTPRECERLQSFPDDWTRIADNTPDSRRYAALGDAVTVNVAEWIGMRLMQAVRQRSAA